MSLENPIISIVTPSRNQAEYLPKTIESVLGQDYPALDFFVVDGGSTDNTLSVLESYGNRVRWVSEPDEGQSAAINKGWRMTTGEVVAWLNADDLYDPGCLQAVAQCFQENPQVGIVYGDCDYIDEKGEQIKSYPTREFDYNCLVVEAVNYIPQPSTFIRRSVLEQAGYLREDLHYLMDYEFWLRAGLHTQFLYLPRKLSKLRVHIQQKSIKNLSGFAGELIHMYEGFLADRLSLGE